MTGFTVTLYVSSLYFIFDVGTGVISDKNFSSRVIYVRKVPDSLEINLMRN